MGVEVDAATIQVLQQAAGRLKGQTLVGPVILMGARLADHATMIIHVDHMMICHNNRMSSL
jgi:hypothetical protein